MKRYILILSLGTVFITGCRKDLLNPVPQTSISDGSAFDSPSRIGQQALALYAAFKAGNLYGGRYLVYGSVRGDEFLSEDPNLVTARDVWENTMTNSSTSLTGLWAAGYSTINQCNLFIDGMNSGGSAVVGAPTAANYIAEARFIRALTYYSLLQYFAKPYPDGNGSNLGLPLRLTGIKGPGFSSLARSSVAEVYTQILDDLNFAETNLPLNYGAAGATNNTIRAHRNSAISFKTRVYLSMRDYAKVIIEANKIVPAAAPFTATSGVAHTMLADYVNVFKTPYASAEAIFSVPFTATGADVPGTQNGLQGYYYASTVGSGIFSLNPTGIIADPTWTATDRRRSFIFTSVTSPTTGKKYLTKFPTSSPADWSPVIRWPEVLLNLAEAKVRQNNIVDVQSLALLNAVRQRSDALTILAPATPADFYTAVLKERQIEFLGEGLRNNDFMRLLLTIPGKGTIGSVAPGSSGYTWPASQQEKSLNLAWVD